MKKLSDVCVNVSETNDNFIGVKYDKGNVKIIFPLGFNIPSDENECKKCVNLLFKIIKLSNEKNLDLENTGNYKKNSNNLPVESYIWVLNDYIANGLYSDHETIYTQYQLGKINWKRTFKTKFLVSHGSLVYLTPIVEKNSNIKNILTEIHSVCIDKSIDIIGPLYSGICKLNNVKETKNKIKYYIQIIEKEMLNSFDDRKKILLYHLKKILQEQIDNGNDTIRNYGIRHFEYVWEYMVNKICGDKNISKYYPTTEYYIKKREKYIPSKLRPDTIFIYNNVFYIIDSKYYKFGITGLNKDLPSSESIQKQITYGQFINNNFNLDNKYNDIYNAFVIPYCKNNNVFGINKNIEFIGYSICNWELSNEFNSKYLKIAIILVDTKYIIESYFNKDKTIKDELILEIKNV